MGIASSTPYRARAEVFANEREAHTDVFENDFTASAEVRARQLVLAWRLDSLWWGLQTRRVEAVEHRTSAA